MATTDRYVGATLPAVTGVSPPHVVAFLIMTTVLVAAPFFVYPVFLMKALCFALFACAFNLLIGYVGLLSFGHAVFLGAAGYGAAHSAKVWGFPPELAILFGTELGILQRILGTVSLTGREWVACILVAFSVVVASELRKLVLRRRAAAAGEDAEQKVAGTLAVPTAP